MAVLFLGQHTVVVFYNLPADWDVHSELLLGITSFGVIR